MEAIKYQLAQSVPENVYLPWHIHLQLAIQWLQRLFSLCPQFFFWFKLIHQPRCIGWLIPASCTSCTHEAGAVVEREGGLCQGLKPAWEVCSSSTPKSRKEEPSLCRLKQRRGILLQILVTYSCKQPRSTFPMPPTCPAAWFSFICKPLEQVMRTSSKWLLCWDADSGYGKDLTSGVFCSVLITNHFVQDTVNKTFVTVS